MNYGICKIGLIALAVLLFSGCNKEKSDQEKCDSGDFAACQRVVVKKLKAAGVDGALKEVEKAVSKDLKEAVSELENAAKELKESVQEARGTQKNTADDKAFTDSRDGKVYATVNVGELTWMARNLEYKTNESYCYEDDESLCGRYGRLYTFKAAQSACPDGWRLPTFSEWESFASAVSGKSLKAKEFGTDDIGFAILPAGFRNSKGKYEIQGKRADFWTASEDSDSKGKYWFLSFKNENLENSTYSKKGAMSVRCIKGGAINDDLDEACNEGSRDHGEIWEVVKTGKYITCGDAHDYGCGWHAEGLMATYLDKDGNCTDLLMEGTPLTVEQLVDVSKVANEKLRKILSHKDAGIYFEKSEVCAYYSENDVRHGEGADEEVCVPFAKAQAFLTSYARDLLK